MRKITDEVLAYMCAMREQGETYSFIAEKTGFSKGRVFELVKNGFTSQCKYVCSNCGRPTNSNRKLCNARECRRIYNREHHRDNWTWIAYKLTPKQIAEMLRAQDGLCALPGCNEILDETNTHVDHDHESGKPRGLLCRKHNNGMGFFNDDPAMLRAAADYIEGAKCQSLLTRTT